MCCYRLLDTLEMLQAVYIWFTSLCIFHSEGWWPWDPSSDTWYITLCEVEHASPSLLRAGIGTRRAHLKSGLSNTRQPHFLLHVCGNCALTDPTLLRDNNQFFTSTQAIQILSLSCTYQIWHFFSSCAIVCVREKCGSTAAFSQSA